MPHRPPFAPVARSLCLVALPLGLAMLALAAANVHAAEPRESARAHYARGLALAAQNGYEAALREFTEAYAISPQFAVLYNIGQVHVALGHPLEAIAALTQYLHDGRDRLPPGRREQVQAQITSLVSSLDQPPPDQRASPADPSSGTVQAVEPLRPAALEAPRPAPTTLAVRCAEPGLKVAVDGKPVDLPTASRGLPVAPGPHRVALSSTARRATEQTLEVAPGSVSVVLCQFLSALPAGAEPRVSFDGPPVFSFAPKPPPPVRAVEVHASTVGIALGALGLALGSGALGVYLWNRGQVDDANALRASLLTENPTSDGHRDRVLDYNERADAINRASVLTVGLAVAGGAALAGGIYLWRRGGSHDPASEPAQPAQNGVALSVAPGAAGLSWNGSW